MLLPAALIVYGRYSVSHLGALGLMVRPRHLVLPWLWLVLVAIDAVLYWSIRKTNIYRRDSLIHIFLFSFALITPYLREWSFEGYHHTLFGEDIVSFMRFVNMAQFFAFWISLILGHALFIKLLVKSRSRRSDGIPEEADPRNLLDDVLTGS